MQMIRYLNELKSFFPDVLNNDQISIAVGSMIFMPDGTLLQAKRGLKAMDEVGKLEGIGGSIGIFVDLHRALQERIDNEIGEKVEVSIEELLDVGKIKFQGNFKGQSEGDFREWVVVTYLCRLLRGEPEIIEPDVIESLKYLTLEELYNMPEDQLSPSTVRACNIYKTKYRKRLLY